MALMTTAEQWDAFADAIEAGQAKSEAEWNRLPNRRAQLVADIRDATSGRMPHVQVRVTKIGGGGMGSTMIGAAKKMGITLVGAYYGSDPGSPDPLVAVRALRDEARKMVNASKTGYQSVAAAVYGLPRHPSNVHPTDVATVRAEQPEGPLRDLHLAWTAAQTCLDRCEAALAQAAADGL